MRRFLLGLFLTWSFVWGAQVKLSTWKPGETFSDYLQRYGIPQALLRSISPEDSKYLSEIQGDESFYELLGDGKLIQALIPIGEEMQIQLTRDLLNGQYHFDIIPIVYRKIDDQVLIEIRKSCYSDIERLTGNPRLGFLLKRLYKGALDFRKLRSGERIAFLYRQKSRLGKPWGQPRIRAAVIQNRGKKRFIFVDEEGRAWRDIHKTVRYTKTGRKMVEYTTTKTIRVKGSGRGSRFIYPVRGARITSRFSYKRWHPILHRYRPHLGVDWGAKRGTPIHAVGSGKVVYAGWMRGYGKVVKIDHGRGYVSLYAHQSRIKVRRGSYVKQGQVIGYVGSTGRSTGAHLHFGLYRNNRAIDPLRLLGKSSTPRYVSKRVTTHHKKMKEYTQVATRKVPIPGAKKLKERLESLLESPTPHAYRWDDIGRTLIYVDEKPRYEKDQQWVVN